MRHDYGGFKPFGVLDGLLPTLARGDNALLVVIIAENVEQLHKAVDDAGRNGLLEGKQVVLITCGDAYASRHALAESMLGHGALAVWIPNRQIPVAAGERLVRELREVVPANSDRETATLLWRIRKAFYNWQVKTPDDPDLHLFENSQWHTQREVPSIRFIG
jgi:hypothetical protein